MPRVPSAPKGKAKLTLAQLASYDDILTDALVDRVSCSLRETHRNSVLTLFAWQAFFWTRIRKNRNIYFSARGIQEENVTSILLHDVIVAKDTAKAENALLGLPGLKRYIGMLRTDQEKDWFKRHLRKYIDIYLPGCPFEVTTTNRYTITTHEAAVSARSYIASGKPIKYLTGTLVPLTPEEEMDLDLTRRDFSIVMSSRKKTPSLFLGPARFSNHDCSANAKLVMRGCEGMEVVATRDIKIGEEITVTYGDNYFGVDNCECLCHACEKAVRNGWAPPAKKINDIAASADMTEVTCPTIESIESNAGKGKTYAELSPDRLKRTKIERSKSSSNEPRYPVETSNVTGEVDTDANDVLSESRNLERSSPSSKRERSCPPVESIEPSEAERTYGEPDSDQSKRRTTETSAAGSTRGLSVASSPDPIAFPMCEGNSSLLVYSRGSGVLQPLIPGFHRQRKSTSTTDESLSCTTTDGGSIDPLTSTPATSISDAQIGLTAVPTERTNDVEVFNRSENESTPRKIEQELPDIVLSDSDDVELSELSDSCVFNDSKKTAIKRDTSTPQSPKKRKRRVWTTIEPETSQTRIPGDYTRTRKLLAQRNDRWVDCHTCFAWFVQSDAYQTRKECPRCERHSKLYGYRWPKTDKEGRNDEEERVMDHRTIHRFLHNATDTQIQRSGRGVSHTVSQTPEVLDAATETSDGSEFGEFRRVTRACRRATRDFLVAG